MHCCSDRVGLCSVHDLAPDVLYSQFRLHCDGHHPGYSCLSTALFTGYQEMSTGREVLTLEQLLSACAFLEVATSQGYVMRPAAECHASCQPVALYVRAQIRAVHLSQQPRQICKDPYPTQLKRSMFSHVQG